ncbi:UBX domain-containing protein 10 [Genypterus blacodes]|uniref:UBX domain-containing protein 10 n=1 Tax=Genypterus blacodes TaxID=154954 RepID=UPI003F7591C7
MHLARPKSSKGRSRPAVNHSGDRSEADSIQTPPGTPVFIRQDSQRHTQPQSALRQASPLSQDQVVHIPAAPTPSLNKYKVLPSIERRSSEVNPNQVLDKRMSEINLSDHIRLQQQHGHAEPDPHTAKAWSGSHISTTGLTKKADADLNIPSPGSDPTMAGEIKKRCSSAVGCDNLLLAVRAPCGGRFQQHFKPTDTLLMVKASAESRYGTKYDRVSVETMDVPRRSFTDMDMTLAQCGIINRSVVCISLSDSLLDHE